MSINPRVARIKIEADGRAGAAETVLELPQTVPDGLAFDDEGTLYCSCYRPDRIYQYADGQLDVLADDYEGTAMAAPTNIALLRPGSVALSQRQLGALAHSTIRFGKTGMPLNYPDIP